MIFYLLKLTLGLLFSSSLVMANEGTLSYGLNWYNRATYRHSTRSFLNPENEVLRIRSWTSETDLRPSFGWEKNNHSLKIGPRLIIEAPKNKSNDPGIFFNEASYQYSLDNHQFVLGLQNYQWGPAEMLSPSNPIFRFLLDQRSLFFQQKGRNLIRWNWTLDNSWSLVSIFEVSKNGFDLPREHQKFSHNGLIKLEKLFNESNNYVGFVIGQTPTQEPFIGEYGAVALNDSFSIYLDARHQYENHLFYANSDGQYFAKFKQEKEDSKQLFHLATAGIRYEGSIDLRLEYIYNGVGLTEQGWNDAKKALSSLGPNLSDNYRRFLFSGRDLYKQHYGYFSARLPDLGKSRNYTIFLRYFNSLQDASSLTQLQIDRETADSFNLYLEAATYSGGLNRDLTSLIDQEVSIGFRWSQ